MMETLEAFEKWLGASTADLIGATVQLCPIGSEPMTEVVFLGVEMDRFGSWYAATRAHGSVVVQGVHVSRIRLIGGQ